MPSNLVPMAFTIRDASAVSGLSRSHLYRLIKSQELPSLRVGGRRMIQRQALEALFDRLSAEAEGC